MENNSLETCDLGVTSKPFLRRRSEERRADRRSFERGVSVAGIAERDADGKTRRKMAPQRIEKIESGPGNGMGSEASNPQHLVHGPAADQARLRLEPRERQVALGIFIACNQLKLHEIPRKS